MANRPGPNTRPKLFIKALSRAIAQDDGVRLRKAAEQLLDLAAAGEQWAVRELADRLDGRSTQETLLEVIDQRAHELPDDELFRIAAGSGTGTAPAQGGSEITSIVH